MINSHVTVTNLHLVKSRTALQVARKIAPCDRALKESITDIQQTMQ